MAILEGCLAVVAAVTATLAYKFFAFPMPPQAEETYKRRVLLLMWWISQTWIKFKLCFVKGHEIMMARVEAPSRSYPEDTVVTEDTEMMGVPVRIFRPKEAIDDKLPGVIYFHGGGWCWEVWEAYDAMLRVVARLDKMVIVSVRYRLAPENPFPAGPDDCFVVTLHVLENTETLCMDPENITLMGDSAGGNLAMVMMIKLLSSSKKIDNLPKVKNMVLIYPALQAMNFKLPSYQQHRGPNVPTVLSSELMVKFYVAYALGMESVDVEELLENSHWSEEVEAKTTCRWIKKEANSLRGATESDPKHRNSLLAKKVNKYFLDPDFSPLLADDTILKRFPNTYVLSAEMDPLRDDSFLLVKRLNELGVRVKHRHWEGMDHAFIGITSLYQNAHKAWAEIVEYLKSNYL